MNPHDWYVEHREAYVARTLEPREEASFEDHLPRCGECREAVQEIEQDLGWLPMGVEPVTPRPGLTRAIAFRVLDHEVRPAWRRWVEPLAIAALLVLAVGLGIFGRRVYQLESELDMTRSVLAALADPDGIVHRADRVMAAPILYAGAQGEMTVFADVPGRQWKVVIQGLPPARDGESYLFWFICPIATVKGADVIVTPDAPAVLTLESPDNMGGVQSVMLTVEPDAGTEVPKGRRLANLRL